ncbi:MAG: hypothetical protein JHC95_10540 [Solirubrobacteraceae bacterium]|nr:hypothetical protein [Solirubrobacteraceae bacterium]
MTRLQVLIVGVLSAFATVGVLVAGVGASGISGEDKAALSRQVTVAAASSSTPVEDDETTESDASDDASATDDAATDTAAADDGAAAEEDVPVGDTDIDIDEFDDTPDSTEGSGDTAAQTEAPKPTKIKHVFVITLQGRGSDAAFGPASQAPYLAKELRPKGALLSKFQSLGKADLPDRLALISGQPPNAATRGNCATYQEIPASTKPDEAGDVTVDGCVYPNTITTLADQVTSAGSVWKAYAEDLEKGPKGAVNCRRPVSNAVDDTQTGRPGDGYFARGNPFVYFHSLLDLSDCEANDGPLTALDADLASAKKTPTLSYIAPNLCNSGTEAPCGLPEADAFLKTWVPKILASPAYKQDGLLVITFAGAAGATTDAPAVNGTLLLSPFARAGDENKEELDPNALLRTIEDALGYKALARAKKAPSLIPTTLAGARNIEPGDD